MLELQLKLDRYNGASVIPRIASHNVEEDESGAHIDAPLGDDEEFSICFDAAKGAIDEALLEAARSLMTQIGRMDNQVQASCAAECTRSGLHPRNFEGVLAFVTVSHDKARLRYFGTGVNTEWDELVERRDGTWVHVGTAAPDLSSRKA